MRTLIVTPTYNERENLPVFLRGVFEVMPSTDVLVVDDASPDGTGELADLVAEQDARVHVLHRSEKLGLGSAYMEAFRSAISERYDVVFEMDADLSHDARYLPAFMSAIESGSDVVVGSRNIAGGGVEGWGLGRQVLSKGGSLYARSVLGLAVQDMTSGFKAFRREVLEGIDLERVRSEGYSFQIELTYRAVRRGFRVTEVPIVFVDRRVGQSKMSGMIVREAVLMVWRLRLDALRGRV